MVERFNQTLEAQLAKFVSDHQRLGSSSATTDDATGETPAMMIMGHDLRLPVYLFIGRPEDEQPVQKTNYTQDLLN